jgi:hypothetical protein
MWITIACIALIVMIILFPVIALVQKHKRLKVKRKEESALNGISAGIGKRLCTAYPDSKWRWVCRPLKFIKDGGIARIEVMYSSGKHQFMDVCLATNGYMALHVLNVVELTVRKAESISLENLDEALEIPVSASRTHAKPCDRESVIKWYNIVLKDTLFALIDDLNAKNEASVNIGQDGKAYVENSDSITVVYDFGEMPERTLWAHITEKLSEEGLFAEVQEENCIFISWA